MGSFGGVNIDAQNFEQTVQSAEQKKILEQQLNEQNRVDKLAQSLIDYRVGLLNSTFPDGQYYVTSDFNSQKVNFQGDARPMDGMDMMPTPVLRNFKKGEIVNVVTFTKDMAMNTVKVIKTDTGNFYADQNNLSKTKPAEPVITESKDETKRRNGDNTKIMIVVAFILGYLLSKE
jgi:hypothetical protein